VATSYPSASVVIPTYDRLDDLKRVVGALEAQHVPPETDLEIVVVDDGSGDGTWEWLQSRAGGAGFVASRQANAGPAKARNRGARAASGELILFLGDDTVPEPGWLLAHLEEHRIFGADGRLAVLGYTTFPAAHETPFLRFINEYGAQFGYRLIDAPRSVPFNFFYTSNISLPRDLLLELGGFREDFPAAAWEDIEFAYRAVAEGLLLCYQPRARCLHHHRIRPRSFCRRQRISGRSAAIFARLHPELEEFLGVGRLGSRASLHRFSSAVLTGLVTVGDELRLSLPYAVYQRLLDGSYLRGLSEGQRAAG
jgi:GT2 family glycosyltransferase